MTHLQKKCLVGSVCLHGLTVAVFLATAAFRSAPTITEEQVLTLIPATVLDRPGVGGEPPPAAIKPQPSPPATVPTPPRPQPQPAPAAPQKQQPNPATPPRNVAATPPRQPDTGSAPTKPAPTPGPTRPGIKVDLTPSAPSARPPSRINASAAQERAAAQEANNRLIQQVAEAFAALGSSVQSKSAPVSVVALPGEGGGEAFVNYRTAVFNAYYQAWKTPEGTTRRLAVADVKIVVGRDGAILSSEFVSKSGDAAVDQSIQRALDQVERQKLPPFPASATDTQRPFIIRFNLEAKQSAG